MQGWQLLREAPAQVGSLAQVPGEGRALQTREREAPTHTAVAKVLVREPRRVSPLRPVMASQARRLAVPRQLVMASQPEEPSAPEVSERVLEIPLAAARMVHSAQGALPRWAHEYLGIPRARDQTAI